MYVMMFNHDDNTTYFSKDIDVDVASKFYNVATSNGSPICLFYRNDEEGELVNLDCNTFDELDFYLREEVKTYIAQLRRAFNEGTLEDSDELYDYSFGTFKDYVYMNSYFVEEDITEMLERGASTSELGNAIYRKILGEIENSYLDGDSSLVYGIVDFKNETMCLGGGEYAFLDKSDF